MGYEPFHRERGPDARHDGAKYVESGYGTDLPARARSVIFCVEDIMNLIMNIHFRACINELDCQINQLGNELETHIKLVTAEKEDSPT